MAAGNPLQFSVTVLAPVLVQFRKWAEEATLLARRDEYLNAFRQTLRRLDFVPIEWADPLYGYNHITAVECRGMIPGWWLVWYGVDTAAKQVIVRSVLPAPGSPLTAEG